VATAAEATFWLAVNAAAGARQVAQAAAFAAYGFVPANLATYKTALVTADVNFMAAVNTAATTAGITPNVVQEEIGPISSSISATIAS
jgi:hypothetical protein